MVEEIGSTAAGDIIINVGPQHPATHGVLHLVITINGETIQKVEPHLGYIHRSIEKMCESLTYRQFIYVTSRMDYLSSHINNHACALCVEKGLQIEMAGLDIGSDAFVKAAQKAAMLKDKIEDASAGVKAFNPEAKFQAFAGVLGGVANGFSSALGALAIFVVTTSPAFILYKSSSINPAD